MEQSGGKDETKKTEGLPLETSPYTQYKDVEDYKRKAYGTEGHQQVQEGRGAGTTDAPTPSGATPPVTDDQKKGTTDISSTDAINRQGVP